MVARHFIWFILLVVLPDFYIDYRFLRNRQGMSIGKRLLWWLPCAFIALFTCWMAECEDFIPRDYLYLEIFMALLGVVVIPKLVFSLSSLIGWGCSSLRARKLLPFVSPAPFRTGERVGVIAAVVAMLLFAYGFTWGFNHVEVRRVELSFKDLPEAFDGYKLVQISDLHVGSYGGWRRHVLCSVLDSISAQHPDLVCFTGDLQNTRPEEVIELQTELQRMAGTISILGNHDYGEYAGGTAQERSRIEERMEEFQCDSLGWVLLRNSHISITDSVSGAQLYIVGTENDGLPPHPSKADYKKAIEGIPSGAFTIMMQHDPSAWERHVLPLTHAQLTLSGHTHGGQISLFGMRPTQFKYDGMDYGCIEKDGRYLLVSGGVGGVVPFRLGMTGEITVITLKKAR